MKNLHMLTSLLLVVGGLNWLLQGLLGWEIGSLFGGMDAAVSRIIYILVGLSAVYQIATHKAVCKMCGIKSISSIPTPSMPTGSMS